MSDGIRALPEWIRFLAAGGVNTLLSLAVYQGMLFVTGHVVAYGIAYLAGIAFAYYAYSRHVFSATASVRRMACFVLFYFASYACGAFLNALLIEVMGWHSRMAIFVTIAAMLPLNFYGSRWSVRGRGTAA